MPAVRKALDDINGKTKAREDAAALDLVQKALENYYAALDRRDHGGVAQDKAFRAKLSRISLVPIPASAFHINQQLTLLCLVQNLL